MDAPSRSCPAPPAKATQVQPRRWVVERIFAWISRRRRCARDYEHLPDHHETIVNWAAIPHMSRRHARNTQHKPVQTVQKHTL
ncbi:transposase [Micromonospora sp. NPDC050795]|uniref:transposase n=1 Tax=Micromonospora sp. NPDC050795 TaxID=3364282 RepID=UPI0037BA31B7